VTVQVELSLGNFIEVMIVSASLLCLVDVQDHLEDLCSEVLRLDGIRGQGKCVTNHGRWIVGPLDRGANHVDSFGLERYPDRLFELSFDEALFKFAVDDVLHTRVNFDALLLLFLDSDTTFCVRVDALVH